jgi:hypothetical protein
VPRLSWPIVWFFSGLAALMVGGALLLDRPTCHLLDERDWRWFARRNAWYSAFDALSVTCGVGLTTFDVDEEHTDAGRWVLVGLGLSGAIFYLLALRALLARLPDVGGVPSARAVLAAFFALLGLSIVFVLIAEQAAGRAIGWTGAGGIAGSVWRATSAFASVGILPGAPPRSLHWIYGLVSLVGGLGFWVWVGMWVGRRVWLLGGRLWSLVGTYLLFLVVIAAVVFAEEAPRGRAAARSDEFTLTGQPAGRRFARAVIQTVCASTSGIPTEDLRERNVTDASRAVLALAVLTGPLGGAAGGGIGWIFLLAGLHAAFSRNCRAETALQAPAAAQSKSRTAVGQVGMAYLVLFLALALVAALGLLFIECNVASAYSRTPTFAAALIDAVSAVGGANLSAGVFEAVTDRNLSRGIRLPVDLYQYGICWLMLAMLAGRLLPLVVLARAGTRRR